MVMTTTLLVFNGRFYETLSLPFYSLVNAPLLLFGGVGWGGVQGGRLGRSGYPREVESITEPVLFVMMTNTTVPAARCKSMAVIINHEVTISTSSSSFSVCSLKYHTTVSTVFGRVKMVSMNTPNKHTQLCYKHSVDIPLFFPLQENHICQHHKKHIARLT